MKLLACQRARTPPWRASCCCPIVQPPRPVNLAGWLGGLRGAMMGHVVEALLIGVGIYSAIAAAMFVLWGAVMGVIIVVAAIFRKHRGAADTIAGAR